MGRIEAGMLMPSRMNERNVGVQWLPVVENTTLRTKRLTARLYLDLEAWCTSKQKDRVLLPLLALRLAGSWMWRANVKRQVRVPTFCGRRKLAFQERSVQL